MPQAYSAIEPVAIDRLADFLSTRWAGKTIYALNLGTGTPHRDAEEAAYVAEKLGPRLLYFQIGNEPDFYRNNNNRLRLCRRCRLARRTVEGVRKSLSWAKCGISLRRAEHSSGSASALYSTMRNKPVVTGLYARTELRFRQSPTPFQPK
jgi:hypothetical protein